ncbi:hypothetical protein TL16_g11063 [Triparma laevis f. inornata]|uniref:Leucine-rich repeat domain-containing protein n=1 Tax=Triparma laevis f. inornata TaxID=1714386 RepID=A0A9W7BCK4_9STRA|nr:hypothetical protein TL16_g11063 [Triparma laevis f. inornata]
MYTPEFRRNFVEFVQGDTLMTLRLATKGWNAAPDAFIDEGVRSGAIIVHDGNDIHWKIVENLKERRKIVTRVIFILNIAKVEDYDCWYAANLVAVDIPEGFESIGEFAFSHCHSLTTVSFPRTLTAIGSLAFADCHSLDNVDLLQSNLQELGQLAFLCCSELKSMTIPDSLQTLGTRDFLNCTKLVPSSIDVNNDNNTTSEVITYLRSKQTPS